MSSTVEQIKERIGIVDLVSSYIKLEKAGKNFKARCPFHNEKTPSFFISPERQTYHCFGCNKGGDIFSFVEEIEGLDFSGALKVLAERAGIPLVNYDQKGEHEKKKLYDILETATQFFERALSENEEAQQYLASRAVTSNSIQKFRIGFVEPEWRTLFTFLTEKGFTPHDIAKTGLALESKGRYYDRFRGRIMFPVADSGGRVIAFSGRIFKEMEGRSEPSAKYINSPETVLYNKSRTLYAFDKAKTALRSMDSCVVVEGQMDVILSHQTGLTHTVAASGTALTLEHLQLIKRFTNNLILSFDADEAGLRAAKRSIYMALNAGYDVKVAHLPHGTDPASLVEQKQEKELEALIRDAKHVVSFYVDMLATHYVDARLLERQIEKEVLPLIAHLQSPIEQAHFVALLSERLQISEEPIWAALKNISPQKQMLASTVLSDRNGILSSVRDPEIERLKKIKRHIHGILLWQEKEKTPAVDLAHFKKKYEDTCGEPFIKHVHLFTEKETEVLIFEMESAHRDGERLHETLEELFMNFYLQILKVRLGEVMVAMKKAEQSGDEVQTKKILAEFHDLSQKINQHVQQFTT